MLATFIGLGVIRRVSRLLHTPLMSLTNAISAIAVVGAILVTGGDYPLRIRILGAIALFASMTNIVSGFLITDRMLKMFKTDEARRGGTPVMPHGVVPARVPRRDGAVHLLAALDERPDDRPQRRLRRRGRHGDRDRSPPGPSPRSSTTAGSSLAIVAGVRRRRAALAGAAHRGAAADRALARLRRRWRPGSSAPPSTTCWLGEGPGAPDAVPDGRDHRRDHPRLPDLHRQPHGRRASCRRSSGSRSGRSPIRCRTSINLGLLALALVLGVAARRCYPTAPWAPVLFPVDHRAGARSSACC